MGVWFDRPATIFDPAPFELLARNSQFVDSTKAYLSGIGLTNSALNSFNSATNFSAREGAVTSYYASEEILQLVRLLLPVVTGTEHRVEFGVDNMLTSRGGLHSQALLTAGLVSDNFRMGTVLVQQSIPLILGEDLYAYDAATSANRNFLIDIIRSDQLIPGNGKLSNFAADLNTLGATVQGLTDAAQKAIVAQAIEWYYWQGTGYAGEDFFATNPSQPSLLQYTTAVGAGLASAENKAAAWANQWLTPIAVAHKAFGGEIAYAQWSVVTGAQGAVATARDATKTQLFIGSTGADVFTGGNVNDKFFAGAGNDSLTGGAGNDQVYGGTGTDTLFGGIGNDSLAGGIGNDSLFGEAGDDTYYYDAGTGNDTITDSDGLGAIFYRPASGTSVMLRGGVRLPGDGAGVFHSYTVNPSTGQITFDSKFTLRCPSNFAFQQAGPMPPLIDERHAC